MATLTNLLLRPPPTALSIITTKPDQPSSFSPSSNLPLFPPKSNSPCPITLRRSPARLVPMAASAAGAGARVKKAESDERVQKVHNIKEFDEALAKAKNRLVVVEYADSHSDQSKQIYPFMVELSRTCNDVDFLLVMGDESEATKELCAREKVEKFPHFSFYKSMEKIHEEERIGPDELQGDVLYYGDNHSAVVQLHSRADVEALIDQNRQDKKMLVLDVGLKHCGPCVKIYPLVLKLSRQMEDIVVFARMNGDENESCMQFLKDMDVIEVPTFLFIQKGKISGRYVGSGKGELIGEILRYQGVRVT